MMMMMRPAIVFCFAVLAISLSRPKIVADAATLYAFGDSNVDVGNNNYLQGAPKTNFLPYGVDFPGGVPTGRATNGFNSVDFVAQSIGLPMSPPAFLSAGDDGFDMRGLNFASGGSGILDDTGEGVISMAAQVKNFEKVAMELAARMGNRSASAFLAEALFFFRGGGNDLSLLASRGMPKDRIVDLLMDTFRNQLNTLHSLGARKFAVMGPTMTGCSPNRRVSSHSGACDEDLNDLSLRFNTAARSLLEELSMLLPGFKYSFGDSYEATERIFANPLVYGNN